MVEPCGSENKLTNCNPTRGVRTNTMLDETVKRKKHGLHMKAVKAYDNHDFLHSRKARHIRIMCEYLETQSRLKQNGVIFAVLFFGSSCGVSYEQWEYEYDFLIQKRQNLSISDPEIEELDERINDLKKRRWLCEYYEKAKKLAYKITEWADTPESCQALHRIASFTPSPLYHDSSEQYGFSKQDSHFSTTVVSPLVVCTGGGPGLMAAANEGASMYSSGRSVGMGVTLPFELGLNTFVHPSLAFEFHYFFMRKFWMVYICIALIAMPGGYGTLDELMEVLVLKQTGKIKRDIPVVLFCKEFWEKTINFDYLVECGTLKRKHVNAIFWTDDVDEAFEYIKRVLLSEAFLMKQEKVEHYNK